MNVMEYKKKILELTHEFEESQGTEIKRVIISTDRLDLGVTQQITYYVNIEC